jgi:GNAT superfamily N-acetyltransferase
MPELTVTVVEAAISRELRRSVLRPALPSGTTLPGDADPGVVHLGAFDGSRLISACLIFPEPCEWRPDEHAWRLRGMATEPDYRGGGAGSALLTEASRIAQADSATILWCLARETAIGFYARNGWQTNGQLFDTEIGPHLRMWLELGPRETS